MAQRRSRNGPNGSKIPLITAITVKGFKSIAKEQRMEIRPLTILAGANSSGKSSMMQPALLIKQTLESSYDPGALLINGPNVKMTEFAQLFWGTGTRQIADSFSVGFEVSPEERFHLSFKVWNGELRVDRTGHAGVVRGTLRRSIWDENWGPGVDALREFVRGLIHVPALRPGSGERLFPKAAVGESFPGTFDDYFASVLLYWKRRENEQLASVGLALESLGLTWKVDARELDATSIEIHVGRLPHRRVGGDRDLVNIADVGFGVSHVLPVVVALWAAKKGDTVYIEQPEVHLHPRAQVRMAGLLADASKRGVRVIAETHSSLLLLGVQTLVAEGKLDPKLVKLHWFQRDPEDGSTTVVPADLDRNGAFGDWPEDFDVVALDSDKRYLDAVEKRSSYR